MSQDSHKDLTLIFVATIDPILTCLLKIRAHLVPKYSGQPYVGFSRMTQFESAQLTATNDRHVLTVE